jgi:pimeloyl-ACP methyl ester carboxylesterase
MMVHVIRLVTALCLLLPGLVVAEESLKSFRVVEDSQSRTVRYLPEEPSDTAVILTHGFSRSPKRMAGHASTLAEHGITTWLPDLYSLMGGKKSRQKNVEFLLGLVRELAGAHLKVILAGHSAGGALSFMAAVKAQGESLPVTSLILLDAVPWDETIDAAPRLQALPLLSMTSESSSMNAWLKVEKLHEVIGFDFTRLYLVGSSHVDPENPPGTFSRAFATEAGRELYSQLLIRYVTGDDFDGFLAEQIRMGTVENKDDAG